MAIVISMLVCFGLPIVVLMCYAYSDREKQRDEEKRKAEEKEDAEAVKNRRKVEICTKIREYTDNLTSALESNSTSYKELVDYFYNIDEKSTDIEDFVVIRYAMQVESYPASGIGSNERIFDVCKIINFISNIYLAENGVWGQALRTIKFFDEYDAFLRACRRAQLVNEYIRQGTTVAEAIQLYEQKMHNDRIAKLQEEQNEELKQQGRKLSAIEDAQRASARATAFVGLSIINRR